MFGNCQHTTGHYNGAHDTWDCPKCGKVWEAKNQTVCGTCRRPSCNGICSVADNASDVVKVLVEKPGCLCKSPDYRPAVDVCTCKCCCQQPSPSSTGGEKRCKESVECYGIRDFAFCGNICRQGDICDDCRRRLTPEPLAPSKRSFDALSKQVDCIQKDQDVAENEEREWRMALLDMLAKLNVSTECNVLTAELRKRFT